MIAAPINSTAAVKTWFIGFSGVKMDELLASAPREAGLGLTVE
jgi:hypothetical protein